MYRKSSRWEMGVVSKRKRPGQEEAHCYVVGPHQTQYSFSRHLPLVNLRGRDTVIVTQFAITCTRKTQMSVFPGLPLLLTYRFWCPASSWMTFTDTSKLASPK